MFLVDLIQTDALSANFKDTRQHKESILFAMIGPILFGLLVGLKNEALESCGGMDKIRLRELARNYREGSGDCGICFEYAVHSAIRNQNPLVMERIQAALAMCGVTGKNTTSILLGFEKSKILQINEELLNVLTDNSRLVTGPYGETIKIREYLERMQASFRSSRARRTLPVSISGIWKSDLFIGNMDTDLWVAASVKINPLALESADGLTIGIVPARWDKESPCQRKNGMVVCPLLYQNGFVQYFYSAWRIVFEFIHNDAYVPHERYLGGVEELWAAKYLEQRRDLPVLELIEDDLKRLAHPSLVELDRKCARTSDSCNRFSVQEPTNSTLIVPDPIRQPPCHFPFNRM